MSDINMSGLGAPTPDFPYTADHQDTAYDPYIRGPSPLRLSPKPHQIHGPSPNETGSDFDHESLLNGPRVAVKETTVKRNHVRPGASADSRLRIVRLIFRGLALAAAVAVLAIHALTAAGWAKNKFLVQTDPETGYAARAWPWQINMKPMYLILGAEVVATAIHLGSLVTLCCGGTVRRFRQTKWYPVVVLLFSIISMGLWIAALVFYKVHSNKGPSDWNMWTWACGHTSMEGSEVQYEGMCTRLNISLYLVIAAVALEAVSLILFLVVWRRERKQGAYSQVRAVKI